METVRPTYGIRTSKRMQQTCRGSTRKHGAMCAAFLPLCAPHFDGCVAVCRLVKCRNPSIAALSAVKMWRIRRIAACLAKSAAIPYPALPAQIQRQTIKVWHVFLSKSGAQIFKNCCILFDIQRTCTCTCTVNQSKAIQLHVYVKAGL